MVASQDNDSCLFSDSLHQGCHKQSLTEVSGCHRVPVCLEWISQLSGVLLWVLIDCKPFLGLLWVWKPPGSVPVDVGLKTCYAVHSSRECLHGCYSSLEGNKYQPHTDLMFEKNSPSSDITKSLTASWVLVRALYICKMKSTGLIYDAIKGLLMTFTGVRLDVRTPSQSV